MADYIAKVAEALRLGRRATGISRQNLLFSIVLLAVLIPSAVVGLLTVVVAVAVHEVSELLAVANGVRAARRPSTQVAPADKPAVLAEAHRVLRPGGRLAITDIATRGALPEAIQHSLAAWAGCVAGAVEVDELQKLLVAAGYDDSGCRSCAIAVDDLELLASSALDELRLDTPAAEELAAAEGRLVSVFIRDRKPPR